MISHFYDLFSLFIIFPYLCVFVGWAGNWGGFAVYNSRENRQHNGNIQVKYFQEM